MDGIRETNGIPVPDPSAATNGIQIVETVNSFLEVFDDNDSTLCGGLVSLRTSLNATDPLSDPRVLYDDTNHRFIVAETVVADQLDFRTDGGALSPARGPGLTGPRP